MDSIKTILHSQKFQSEAPKKLNLLINRRQRENLADRNGIFAGGRGKQEANETRKITSDKKKNVA